MIYAIRQVESSSVDALAASIAPEDLVTMSEAAKRLQKSRQVLSLGINEARRKSESNPFPPPRMRLADKSPLWKWREIVEWLYFHNLIKEKKWVEKAVFIENLNAVLEFRDKQVQKVRKALQDKLKG